MRGLFLAEQLVGNFLVGHFPNVPRGTTFVEPAMRASSPPVAQTQRVTCVSAVAL
jgi:hypothetical protein